jgi:hypothetical protein
MKPAVAFRLLAARRRLEAAMWGQRWPVIQAQLIQLRGTHP